MTRGLIWLPLLALFFWLAWAGWNEYQKVEAYRGWAAQFDRAKYDILAVLGQRGEQLTWGKPTRQGMIELQSFSLGQVKSIELLADDRSVDLAAETLPSARRAALAFEFANGDQVIQVPFTELGLAQEWGKVLRSQLPRLQSKPNETM
ncbi:MAG: hypothetical protein HC895_03400 [Leptolyngbyaceae cyanobacterium SM1_3_5]|nr:hypothetical protein [Leptolyngbyaceae cyanobacterium SM1_3_5]